MLLNVALPIEDRERNLTKSILARVCTLIIVCGLKQDISLLCVGTNLHECLE